MKTICDACGGACCSFKTMRITYNEIEPGTTLQKHLEENKWKVLFRTNRQIPNMDFYYTLRQSGKRNIEFDCHHLSKKGECRIYDTRPSMCIEFKCDALKGEMKLGEFLREHSPRTVIVDRIRITKMVREAMTKWKRKNGKGRKDGVQSNNKRNH